MDATGDFRAIVARHRELPHYPIEEFIELCGFDPADDPFHGVIVLNDIADDYRWVPQFQFYATWPTDRKAPYPPKIQPIVRAVNLLRRAHERPHDVTEWWIQPHWRIIEATLPNGITLPASTELGKFARSSPAALVGKNSEVDGLILTLAESGE